MEAAIMERDESEAERLFQRHQHEIFCRTDRLFAGLMTFQWFAGVVAALWISPKTWAGTQSQTHMHVWAALLLGGAITSLPVPAASWPAGRVSW